jgi:hypothetical protein
MINALISCFKAIKEMVRSDNEEYNKKVDSALNELEMASISIVAMLYMIDILYYTAVREYGGIGVMNCILFLRLLT